MDFQNFHITNKALIFHRNKFLLIHSDDPEYFGALECPGGRVNRGELLADALHRELLEETDLDLNNTPHETNILTVNQRDEVEYDWDDKTQIIEIYYKIMIPDDYEFNPILHEEGTSFEWISVETDLDKFTYRVLSRKDVYKKAQSYLKT